MESLIRRPDVPEHFMVLRPITRRIVIRLPDGTLLADSSRAVRLLESGKTLYDPIAYLPKQDVKAPLVLQADQTICPLKGTASYYGIEADTGPIDKLAWSYHDPLHFAREIQELIAFYPDKVVVEEHPK